MNLKIKYYNSSKRRIAVLSILISLFSFSCKKYLDVKLANSQIVLKTATDCQLVLDNYSAMNTNFPSDGELSAGDFYMDTTGFFNSTAEAQSFYIWSPQAIRSDAGAQWTNDYTTVYNANIVLECLANIHDNTPQVTLNNLKGSALLFRAYAFWQVAQLYAKPYIAASASADPGIPLRLSSDVSKPSVRSTVQQTYDQITGDLKLAASLLQDSTGVVSRPNRAAAYAMLARVYLSMGDYTDALTASTSSLNIKNSLLDYNTITPGVVPVFPNRFNTEELFHTVMVQEPELSPGYPPYRAPIAMIDTNLVHSYAANDLRSTLFFRGGSDGSYGFTGNYEPAYATSVFFDGLAVDEVYLTRAECYARAGNAVAAMADLNTLLVNRWVTGTYTNMTASSADDALAKILVERRKELVMRGLRWTDLRRLNQDPRFAVTLTRVAKSVTYTLPPNDPRYTLLLPQPVVTYSGMQQNTR
jgi:hypothetical protein